jgi:GTPase SAR1 family protein
MDDPSLRLPMATTVVVSGPSGVGKTVMITSVLENLSDYFYPVPEIVYRMFKHFQPELMGRFGDRVIFIEGVDLERVTADHRRKVLVVDDLMHDIAPDTLSALFTRHAHHDNFCAIFFVTQSIFDKKNVTARRNAKILLLFKSLQEKLSIKTIALQMYPRDHRFLVDAYESACSVPYKYLCIDMRNEFPDQLRIRDELGIRTHSTTFFCPSNGGSGRKN